MREQERKDRKIRRKNSVEHFSGKEKRRQTATPNAARRQAEVVS